MFCCSLERFARSGSQRIQTEQEMEPGSLFLSLFTHTHEHVHAHTRAGLTMTRLHCGGGVSYLLRSVGACCTIWGLSGFCSAVRLMRRVQTPAEGVFWIFTRFQGKLGSLLVPPHPPLALCASLIVPPHGERPVFASPSVLHRAKL